MTYPGAPCVYYGDEIGLEGGHDPGCRAGFPWDPRGWNQSTHEHVKRCIALRHAHPALRRGDFTWLFAGSGVVAYGRRLETETLIVVLNTSMQPVMLSLPVTGFLPDGSLLRNVWRPDQVALPVRGGLADGVQVPARSGTVLEVIPDSQRTA
jgi:neopullulanase